MPSIYAQIDGIPGEATDQGHEKWIRILSLNHGVTQPHNTAQRGGAIGPTSQCEHQDLVLTKFLDKASPLLMARCCDGKRTAKTKIEICRQVDTKVAYQTYELEGVYVRGYNIFADNKGEDEKPTEEIALAYEKITMKYTEVDPKTNQVNGDTMTYWDMLTNAGG